MRGRFITFEGGEGAGKSTQVTLLAERLHALGIDVVVTREPGGSPGAEAIRHVLLSGAAQPLGAHAEAILFAAARDDHVQTVIAPALAQGQWVICDRFADSTRVYQGELGAVDARFIAGLERLVVGETRPDLTLILDLPVYIGLARAARRRSGGATDRFEAETSAFHDRLRLAYRELVTREPGRCVLIDARGDALAVADAVWQTVEKRFGLSGEMPPMTAEAVR
jgi:dTMP kinase